LKYTPEYLADRTALEDAVVKYCTAVDRLNDVEDLLTNFTEDAVFDLTGLHLPRFVGHGQIRDFFKQVFRDMSHHGHLLTNFRVERLAGDEAQVKCYVTGMGRSKAGIDILVYVWYELQMRRTPNGWKIAVFYEAPLMPMPESVTAVHKKG
jgi:ketosteroid isomerase-like protein